MSFFRSKSKTGMTGGCFRRRCEQTKLEKRHFLDDGIVGRSLTAMLSLFKYVNISRSVVLPTFFHLTSDEGKLLTYSSTLRDESLAGDNSRLSKDVFSSQSP